jgi:hypothetical protein
VLGTVLDTVANNKEKKQLNHGMALPFQQCCESGFNKVSGSRSKYRKSNDPQKGKTEYLILNTTNNPWRIEAIQGWGLTRAGKSFMKL